MTRPRLLPRWAAGGRSGPHEAPPGRAKGLPGKFQVQDAQAWAERKRALRGAPSAPAPRAAWSSALAQPPGAEGRDGLTAGSCLCLHAGVRKLALYVFPQVLRLAHCGQHLWECWPALWAGAGGAWAGTALRSRVPRTPVKPAIFRSRAPPLSVPSGTRRRCPSGSGCSEAWVSQTSLSVGQPPCGGRAPTHLPLQGPGGVLLHQHPAPFSPPLLQEDRERRGNHQLV